MSTDLRAHGNHLAHDPERLRPRFDLERSIAVFEDGQIVGGCHSHLLEMSIPGGVSVVAGVSNVEVQPTHTRRGVMTLMMRDQIDGFHGWVGAFAFSGSFTMRCVLMNAGWSERNG